MSARSRKTEEGRCPDAPHLRPLLRPADGRISQRQGSEALSSQKRALFRRASLNQALERRDQRVSNGLECGWVHTVLLAWQRHYGGRR